MKHKKIDTIKTTGFEIPKNYFEGLEDQIMAQTKISEVDNSGFKLPDGYMDTLEDQLMSALSQKTPPKVVPLFGKRTIIYASSIAATVLLLLNLSLFEKDNSELEDQTVENYIINEAMSSYDIASLLEDEDLIEENFVDHNFSEEHIENYVLDHLDDIEELILE